jgi:tight adherence protein B
MPAMFVMLMMTAGIFGVLLLLYAALTSPSASRVVAKRLESVRVRHSRSTEVAAQAQLKRILSNRQTSRADGFAQRFIPNPALLRKRLEQTGRSWTLAHYVGASLGIAVIVALLLMFKGAPLIIGLSFGALAGAALPHFIVGKLIKRRINLFTARFPDAIDLMVRGLRSGLPISETIGVVANEIQEPVKTEFRTVSDKMRIGRTMEAALTETAERLNTPEFQFFVISLAIQRETGGNLAETLSNLTEVLRKRAAMKLKIRAMSSESKASAYIIGALPFIVFGLIWFINGKYMQSFFVDTRLMIIGAGGLVWMGLGAFIMSRMVNFEI